MRTDVQIFIPQLVELYRQGQFPFVRPVKFYPFEDISQAAQDSTNGTTFKPILRIAENCPRAISMDVAK
jgi:aryl-alcohol dehydrogenase